MEWIFPPTSGGVSHGFNDSSEEHFKTNPLENAIRETIQNSLDARDARKNIVKVNICRYKIKPSDINSKELIPHIRETLDVEKKRNKKAAKFYEESLKVIKCNTIPVLAIIDSNTTGLIDKHWDSLVYMEGTPDKSDTDGTAGGSFGIGKNAAYSISPLRMVCYTTRYQDKSNRIDKFIARCRLSAHPSPKKPSEELQNIGFGGVKVKDTLRPMPVIGKNIPNKIFRLEQKGTGIFIIGFKHEAKNFVKEISSYVIHHFFTAIHEKKLEVTVESHVINHQTLDGIFEEGDPRKASRHYYHTLREPEQKTNIKKRLGNFELFLRTSDDRLPNKVAYVNRRGMMITDETKLKKNPFRVNLGSWVKYSAVLRATDDNTANRILDMEPPDHRSIEWGRYIGAKLEDMKSQLREVQSTIEDFIVSVIDDKNSKEEVIIEELQNILSIPGKEGSRESDIEQGGKFESRIINVNRRNSLATNTGGVKRTKKGNRPYA